VGYNSVADNNGSIFIRLAVVAFEICDTCEILRKFELQSHPRSL